MVVEAGNIFDHLSTLEVQPCLDYTCRKHMQETVFLKLYILVVSIWLVDCSFPFEMVCVTLPVLCWRGGLAVKSMCCSSRGPGFSSQNPHRSSQASITPETKDFLPSSGHMGKVYNWCTDNM